MTGNEFSFTMKRRIIDEHSAELDMMLKDRNAGFCQMESALGDNYNIFRTSGIDPELMFLISTYECSQNLYFENNL